MCLYIHLTILENSILILKKTIKILTEINDIQPKIKELYNYYKYCKAITKKAKGIQNNLDNFDEDIQKKTILGLCDLNCLFYYLSIRLSKVSKFPIVMHKAIIIISTLLFTLSFKITSLLPNSYQLLLCLDTADIYAMSFSLLS